MSFTSACLPKRELIGLLISLKLVSEFLEGAAITAAGATESFCKTDAPLYDLLEVIIKLKAISLAPSSQITGPFYLNFTPHSNEFVLSVLNQ